MRPTPVHPRPRRRRVARYGPLIFALAVAPTLALAHAILVESSPKQDEVLKSPATRAVLRFNARIEKGVTRATLRDAAGHDVKLPPIPDDKDGPPERLIIALPPLKPGAYQLEYRVLAADGHATPGLLKFSVAPAAPTTAPKHPFQDGGHGPQAGRLNGGGGRSEVGSKGGHQ
jgi:methionine-rich copper-binding protein CopC